MNLEAFRVFASDQGMPLHTTFQGDGSIEPAKGGDAIYFPEINAGAIVPNDDYPIYFNNSPDLKHMVKVAINKANGNPPAANDPAGATNESNVEPFPIDLSGVDIENPSGIAGEICDYLKDTAYRKTPLIYPLVALQTLTLVADGRKGHHGGKLNLLTLAIALSASGKEHGQAFIAEIARSLKLGRHIVGSISSDVDMIRNLIDAYGFITYRIDEIQGLFKSINSKNANTYESKIGELILSLITAKTYIFSGNHRRHFLEQITKDIEATEKKLEKLKGMSSDSAQADYAELSRDYDQLKIKREYVENGWPNPMVSIMGHSTPAELDGIVNEKSISSGLIGRSLIIRCGESREQLSQPISNSQERYDSIVERLEALKRAHTQIAATTEAQELLKITLNYYDDDEQRNHPVLGAVYARAFEQVTKVANLLALETGTVDASHVKYAAKLVNQSISDIKFLMAKSEAQTGSLTTQELIEHTKDLIRRRIGKKTATPSQLKNDVTKSCKKLINARSPNGTQELFDFVLSQMVTAGEIRFFKEGRRARYELVSR